MLKADLLAPSALGHAERAAWGAMLAASPPLQRAFLTPGFALACEAAGFRVRVAVLHEAGRIRAFLPFQHKSAWHAALGLAERVGGTMSDHAGLIAEDGVRIAPAELLRLCRLGGIYLSHLQEAQQGFGLTAERWRIGHRIDLDQGAAAYFEGLGAARRPFVNDTARRWRRAQAEFGELAFTATRRPAMAAVQAIIAEKRAQYRRTGAEDVLADGRRIALLRHLVERPAADCEPFLGELRAGDRVLARHLGLLHAGVLSYWFPVYDPAAQKVSPGRLLLWQTIREADALGIRMIDRGEGDSEAKRDFSSGTTQFGEAYYAAGTAWGGAARLLQAMEWRFGPRLGVAWS
ncbi:MAG: GNAT family N-acetyltransferase [Acetobacteraceae bacterium]|nr:GNAT family N-acetyltransferase [Acetobacteraceae bacterium]